MNRVKVDIVERLRDVEYLNQRPGTADSDVNVFALPVQITYGDLEVALREIENLRSENEKLRFRIEGLEGIETFINWRYLARAAAVEWSVVNDITDWSLSADTGSTTIDPWGSLTTDKLIESMHQRRDVIAAKVLNTAFENEPTLEPWGSPYAMNPENWT